VQKKIGRAGDVGLVFAFDGLSRKSQQRPKDIFQSAKLKGAKMATKKTTKKSSTGKAAKTGSKKSSSGSKKKRATKKTTRKSSPGIITKIAKVAGSVLVGAAAGAAKGAVAGATEAGSKATGVGEAVPAGAEDKTSKSKSKPK